MPGAILHAEDLTLYHSSPSPRAASILVAGVEGKTDR